MVPKETGGMTNSVVHGQPVPLYRSVLLNATYLIVVISSNGYTAMFQLICLLSWSVKQIVFQWRARKYVLRHVQKGKPKSVCASAQYDKKFLCSDINYELIGECCTQYDIWFLFHDVSL